jgi:hypothetical protein
MIKLYEPAGVEDVVRTVTVEEPVPPGTNVTLIGLKETVTVDVAGETVTDWATVPLSPKLLRFVVNDPVEPALKLRDVRDAAIEKSAVTLRAIETRWLIALPVLFTRTVYRNLGVDADVWTVSVDVPVPLATRLTLGGLIETLSPDALGLTEVEIVTVPAKL